MVYTFRKPSVTSSLPPVASILVRYAEYEIGKIKVNFCHLYPATNCAIFKLEPPQPPLRRILQYKVLPAGVTRFRGKKAIVATNEAPNFKYGRRPPRNSTVNIGQQPHDSTYLGSILGIISNVLCIRSSILYEDSGISGIY
jgi:hypothetical protein